MHRRTLVASLFALSLAPMAALAQTDSPAPRPVLTDEQRAARRDRNQSARELRQERRQPGDPAGQRDARRDLRQDQRALRRERRDGLN
jgi:hypothetical protein